MSCVHLPFSDYGWIRELCSAQRRGKALPRRLATADQLVIAEGDSPALRYDGEFALQSEHAVNQDGVQRFLEQIDAIELDCKLIDGILGAAYWIKASPNLSRLRLTFPDGVAAQHYQVAFGNAQTKMPNSLRELDIKLAHAAPEDEIDALAATLDNICASIQSLRTLKIPLNLLWAAWKKGHNLAPSLQNLVISPSSSSQLFHSPQNNSLQYQSLRSISVSATFPQITSILRPLPQLRAMSLSCGSVIGMAVALQSVAHNCRHLTSMSLDLQGTPQQSSLVTWQPLLQIRQLRNFSISYSHNFGINLQDLDAMFSHWPSIEVLRLNASPMMVSPVPTIPVSALLRVAHRAPNLTYLEISMDCFAPLSERASSSLPSREIPLTLDLGPSFGHDSGIGDIAEFILKLFPRVDIVANGRSRWVTNLKDEVDSRQPTPNQ